jgi:hypothetical protein
MLARLEVELLLAALARRVKTIELNGTPERKLNGSRRPANGQRPPGARR